MGGVSARRILPMICIQSWRVAQVSDHADWGRAGQAEWGSGAGLVVGELMTTSLS